MSDLSDGTDLEDWGEAELYRGGLHVCVACGVGCVNLRTMKSEPTEPQPAFVFLRSHVSCQKS